MRKAEIVNADCLRLLIFDSFGSYNHKVRSKCRWTHTLNAIIKENVFIVAIKKIHDRTNSITLTNHKTFMGGIDKCARFADAASRGWREAVMTPAGE